MSTTALPSTEVPSGPHDSEPDTTAEAIRPIGEHALDPYDAILLLSFGGPEGPEDVVPFLQNVTKGRGIPAERLAEVGQHYYLFGGKSPINDQCRALLRALSEALTQQKLTVPLYWGNRNWKPYLADTMAELAAAGHQRVLVIPTSAYPSYSSCRQYREDLFVAAQDTPIRVDKIRQYATHPSFAAASVDATLGALQTLSHAERARLVFVTHSIPQAMAVSSGHQPRTAEGAYPAWHRAVAQTVTAEVNRRLGWQLTADLAYCSRSGPPHQPWLEPDINDHLTELSQQGVDTVVVVPIGFISDHMEVIFDLDTEAAATAERLGLQFARAATAGVHPVFVQGLIDLALERAALARGEEPPTEVIAGGPAGWSRCPADCCPNLRDPERGALCGR